MNNAKQVKDCVGMYEAIGRHAKKINETKFTNFFALVQTHALQLAVLGIAKIYDATNKHYKKHTIYNLDSYFRENLDHASLRFSGDDIAIFLGLTANQLNQMLWHTDVNVRLHNYRLIYNKLNSEMPKSSEHKELEKIITFRHKFVSHQEQLTEVESKQHRQLPPLEVFISLAEYAEDYAAFVAASFSNVILSRHTIPSAKVGTYNIIKKVLDLAFDLHTPEGYKAWQEFYERAK